MCTYACSYVDHFMYKGHLCIVTDYCDAGDLYQMLRARKTALPEAQLLDLLVQVIMAIQYIHQKNILHRGGHSAWAAASLAATPLWYEVTGLSSPCRLHAWPHRASLRPGTPFAYPSAPVLMPT